MRVKKNFKAINNAKGDLIEQKESLEKLVEHREEIYERRTENWKNGDNAYYYRMQTDQLRNAINDLNIAISSISETEVSIEDYINEKVF